MRHFKVLSLVGIVSFLGACAPTFPVGPDEGRADYEYIGCHKVAGNPAGDGSVAFGPFGLDPITHADYIFFKQQNPNGSVSKVNVKPC